jgi:epoxyqueuosine reductase
LTIELRASIPEEFREPMGNHVFGCDICQDVCPWNRRAPVSTVAQFQPRTLTLREAKESKAAADAQCDSLFRPRLESLLSLSEEDFRELFRGSPVKRTKWRGLVRNACIAAGNSKLARGSPSQSRLCECLRKLAACGDSVVAESAQWALSRIQ